MDARSEITISSSLAADNKLNAGSGLLGFVQENIAKPFANGALIESRNAVSSSINDAASMFGSGPLLNDATPFALHEAEPLSAKWAVQTASTVAGSIAPYVAAIALTSGGLSRLAGKGESMTASVLRHRTTGSVLGAGIFDGLRKPKENETRLGNALGGATAFLIFEGGNHLAKNITGSGRWMLRGTTGGVGGAGHQLVSDLVSKRELSSGDKYLTASASGAVMNIAMPAIMDRLLPAVNKPPGGISETSSSSSSTLAATETVVSSESILLSPRRSRGFFSISEASSDHLPPWLGNEGLRSSDFPVVEVASRAPDMPTSGAVSTEAIQEFYRQIARTMREFRRSPEYATIAAHSESLIMQSKEHSRAGRALLFKLNADRPIEQVSLYQMTEANFVCNALGRSPQAWPRYQEWEISRVQLQQGLRSLRKELKPLKMELEQAMNGLGEELLIPRVSLKFKLLGKTDGEYVNGREFLNTRLVTASPTTMTEVVGHETAHAHQETLIIRDFADRLGIGRMTTPEAVARVQGTIKQDLGHDLGERWVRSVLAMRDGRRLTNTQAEYATKLIVGWNETGAPGVRQRLARDMGRYLHNPEVSQPLSTLLGQLQEKEVARNVVFSGQPTFQTVQERWRLLGQVDTPENVGALSNLLRTIWKNERINSYTSYMKAYHEQDAYSFQYRIREVAEQMKARKNSN